MVEDRCGARIIHQDKVNAAREGALSQSEIRELSQFFKAYADPSRLRIVYALGHQEMCVCDLAALLEISESAVSHQLRLLRTMKLVKNRREGTTLYYSLADDHIMMLIDYALEHLGEKQDGPLP